MSPVQKNAFLGAGDGKTRSYKYSHAKEIHNFFHMISDDNKFYTKIVDIEKIYNFVVNNCFI